MNDEFTFWYSMSEEILLEVLWRAYTGENPEDLVAEMFCNAE